MPMTIRLEPELEERYRKLAETTGRSQAYYIRQALEKEIDELEWTYDILRVSEDVKAGKEPTYSLAEVREHLGL